MSAVIKLTGRGNASGISIPKIYLRELGWIEGDYLKLDRAGDALIVARLGDISKRPRPVKREEAPADA